MSLKTERSIDEMTPKMDEQLAAGQDFYDRLCLAKTSPSDDDDATFAVAPGNEVAAYKLWPALKFDSHREFMDHLKMVQGVKSVNKLCGKMTVEYNRSLRAAPHKHPKSYGVAYLFGRGSLSLVPKNAEGIIEIDDISVFDFCRHCEEMEQGEGHCGTEEFQHAFKLALHRMEASLEMEMELPPSPAKMELPPSVAKKVVEKMEKAVTGTTVSSARKTYTSVKYSPVRTKRQVKKYNAKTAALKSTSPRRISMRRSPVKKEDESMTSAMDEAALPVKTVEFSGNQGSSEPVSSPEKPSSGSKGGSSGASAMSSPDCSGCFTKDDETEAGGTPSAQNVRKSNRTPSSQSEIRDMAWPDMWNKMKSEGWSHIDGSGLIAWFYLHPTCAGMKKTEILKDKKEGTDYFTNDDDVKWYARVNLGWKTNTIALCADSPKDAEMADRVKKRKRGKSEVKPVVEIVKEQPKKEPKKSTAKPNAKKQVDVPKVKKPVTVPKGKKPVTAPKAKKPVTAPKAKKPVNVPKAKKPVNVPKAKKPVKAEPAPSSPESQGSEDSRFSKYSPESSEFSPETSVTQRTRSKTDTPTISECEADLGVKQSAKMKNAGKKLQFAHEDTESSVECASLSQSATSGSPSGSEGSSGSESPSEQSSLDATYQVMASRDAWHLLQDRFGFSYLNGKHCLPGKDNRPGKDSAAIEGIHYFDSLIELRKHLCAYGLPELKPQKNLSEEEVIGIERWVRYAHVINLRDAAMINPNDIGEPLTFLKAWTMLAKLGLRYSGGRYAYPNSDPSKARLKFERQQDCVEHLARFGIPRIDGNQPNDVLNEDDRLMLDLYIASTLVDTFKRIHPSGEDVNEITPRRNRRSCSNVTESALVRPAEQKITRPPVQQKKHALNHGAYQMEFNELLIQRTFPSKLMSSQDALSILVDNYNFSVLQRDGEEYYCLPNVSLTEREEFMPGRDYFETVQDMRENLCAFGLPPIAKGTKLSEATVKDLEFWVRCANMNALQGEEPAAVPYPVRPKPKEAKATLKRLGYTFRDNYNLVLLPETSCHKSKPGINRFEKIIDIFNHVARFGLETEKAESELAVSQEERLNLEVFVATVATFDVCKRIKCDAPIIKKSSIAEQESATTAQPAANALNTGQDDAATKSDVASSPIQHALVVDEGDQDTPQPSPPKKPRTNPITNFFTAITGNATTKAFDAVESTFSPTKMSPRRPESSPASSSLGNLSPSCLDTRGDDEVEACFADPLEQEVSTAPESAPQNPENDEVEACFPDPPEQEVSTTASVRVPLNPENQCSTPRRQVKRTNSMGQCMSLENSSALKHLPQAESPNMLWKDLWAQMRKAGWVYLPGNDLIAWYWVHPSAAKMKKGEVLRQCTEGIHYFTTECDIHQYATEHLGWVGEGINSSPTPSDKSMTSRVKRKQTIADKQDASSPPKRSRASSEGSDKQVGSTPKKSSPTKKSHSSPKNGGNDAAKSSPGKNPGSKISDSIIVNSQSILEKEHEAPPDEQPTVRDKLECCQMVLHPSFKKNQLSKSSSMSVVSSMEDDIKDFMTKSIETGTTVDGMTSPSPGFMYICGGPGTGKTTAVSSCSDEMKKWAKHNGYDRPRFCVINMAASLTSSTCKGGIMRAMLKKIASVLEIDKDAKITTFEKEFKKKVLVLVLDEVDMLFKNHGGIGENWFKTLVDWAEDKGMCFSMIGISNCVNDTNATRVRELGHSPRELVFSAYNEEDILAILEQRLGKKVVDHKALQLISRRVAASSGDARRALEITSNAVGKCSDLLSDEKLDMAVEGDDECMPLVKLPHMMRAIREGMPMRHGDVISGLPQAAKVILCIAVSLGQVWGPMAEISISQLKKYCVEATHHAIMDELGLGHIMNLVEMLVDSGLLVTGNSGHFNPQDVNAKLKIGVQMDDVEIALEQSLLKEGGFYQSLVDYVKRECPRVGST